MTSVAVLDYGMGNLRSVCKALEQVAPKAQVHLTHDPEQLRRSDRVVFPGQGAIGACMTALNARGLRDSLREAMVAKPFLGICLGLQALYDFSEEDGGTACLSVLAGSVKHFPMDKAVDRATGRALKVPHMGWNEVEQVGGHPLWRGVAPRERFYFVHSYYADGAERRQIAGITDYAIPFTSAAARDNIFAVQFHPEKSQKAGLQLLENFMHWDGSV